MTTFTITGNRIWNIPQNAEEAARMETWVKRVDGCQGRCETCAFRTGTDANRSRLVEHLIGSCLLSGDTFMCHTGLADDETPHRPCAGYVALTEQFEIGGKIIDLMDALKTSLEKPKNA